MTARLSIAALLATLVAVLAPAAFAGPDPVATVTADLATLSTDVSAAHTALLADANAIETDAAALTGTTDKAAARTTIQADVAKFRTDRQALIPPIQADLKQLRADLKAAHDANVDPSTLRPLVQSALTADRAALKEIRQASQQAHRAVMALSHSFRPHGGPKAGLGPKSSTP
jgi:hypothetical protein